MANNWYLKRMVLRCYACALLGLMILSATAAVLGHFTFFEPVEAQVQSSVVLQGQHSQPFFVRWRAGQLQLPEPTQSKVQIRHLTSAAFVSGDAGRNDARLNSLASRVLIMRHLVQITRAHMLASIPSINPAGNAAVVGCYCYRTFPTAEFHSGVDLDANYGDVVRAAAAGTVVSADYDGAYGLKVDIDHGNGYHTWYAHLSHADVHPGEKVAKSQSIALVGSTGRSTGPHLHYQVMLHGQAIDPAPFLKGIPPQVLAALP